MLAAMETAVKPIGFRVIICGAGNPVGCAVGNNSEMAAEAKFRNDSRAEGVIANWAESRVASINMPGLIWPNDGSSCSI